VVYVKRTVHKRGDKRYAFLSLVEAVRAGGKKTQRELFRLGEVGELERTGQLDRIVAALSSYTNKNWVATDALEGAGAPSHGAVAAVATCFDRLGLRTHFAALGEGRHHQHLADTVFVMVENRLLDPGSKRRTILEWLSQVALPDGVSAPLLDQCRRAPDVIAEQKEATEEVLYRHLTDLSNLDLRLVLYDLTSTYLETSHGPSPEFSSRAYGDSRDKRDDRPQVVISLLVTGNGIPIAHYVFPGNTRDSTTLRHVMTDYQARFGVGKIALVCDRGLISEQNLADVAAAGFDHVLATRLHHDRLVAAVRYQDVAGAVNTDVSRSIQSVRGRRGASTRWCRGDLRFPETGDDIEVTLNPGRACAKHVARIRCTHREHFDFIVARVLEEAVATGEGGWTSVPGVEGTSCCEVTRSGRRFVVVFSEKRKSRDDRRREELLARTEQKLITLADRVRAGKLVDPAKIGPAGDRILRDSGVSRCFAVTIRHGVFSWRFDEEALSYEEKLLAGRHVLVTSLSPKEASAADVVRHYRMLKNVERRFRVMKDFLGLRPVHHRLEERVRAHIAPCVIAAVIEAVMGDDLAVAQLKAPICPNRP
jgi:hypothetical protein